MLFAVANQNRQSAVTKVPGIGKPGVLTFHHGFESSERQKKEQRKKVSKQK